MEEKILLWRALFVSVMNYLLATEAQEQGVKTV